jgi:hypothetical protein
MPRKKMPWGRRKRPPRECTQNVRLARCSLGLPLSRAQEHFEVQLAAAGQGAVVRYGWHYARWHAMIYHPGLTAFGVQQTLRWRIKGAGDLLHSRVDVALSFLRTHMEHRADGVRRVKQEDGVRVELPATERTQCKEALWRLYEKSHAEAQPLSRSQFLQLADLIAGATQGAYSALDSFSVQNGRKQAISAREGCDELRALMQKITSLPLPADRVADLQAKVARVSEHAAALKAKVDRTESFIKRGLPLHVPTCADAEPAADVPTCPEHCRACAFGTSSADASRCSTCTREHSVRCVECSDARALTPDFVACFNEAEQVIKEAEMLVGAGGDADAGNAHAGAAAVADTRREFDELRLFLTRALLRFEHYLAHERRAVHESKVLEMLLRGLGEDACVLVADWKVSRMPRRMVPEGHANSPRASARRTCPRAMLTLASRRPRR